MKKIFTLTMIILAMSANIVLADTADYVSETENSHDGEIVLTDDSQVPEKEEQELEVQADDVTTEAVETVDEVAEYDGAFELLGDGSELLYPEMFFPIRGNLYIPDAFDPANLGLNKENVFDEDGNTIGRRIYSTKTSDVAVTSTRFKVADFVYGTLRWKNSCTWEFDFKIDEMTSQFAITIGKSQYNKVSFKKDSKTEQYYIIWDGTSTGISHTSSVIWAHKDGTMLQYGKTYHIKIEWDARSGENMIVTFSDPETGYVRTTSRENTLTYTQDDYVNTNAMYSFAFASTGLFSMTTYNEKFYYNEYYVLSKDVSFDDSTITSSVSLMNCVNHGKTVLRAVPCLFTGVYDKNGAMVKSSYIQEAEVMKQESADNQFLTAKIEYSDTIDVSELADGDYTVKTCLWRSIDEPIVGASADVKEITICDGGIVK